MTVSEGFVSDAGRFVEVMDRISGGKFLRGEESKLTAPWVELPWLKEKGYFSLEAFVANRLEVALRLSWLSCSHGGKKQRGAKAVKEKGKAGVAGVAANAFWRKKGALDWWAGLDPGGRKKFFQTFIGKTAKYQANEITKDLKLSWDMPFDSKLHGEFQLRYGPSKFWQKEEHSFISRYSDFSLVVSDVSTSGIPESLANYLNSLLVLQDMSPLLTFSTSNSESSVFFSTLASCGTTSDCILRKLQQIIMVVSVKYRNVELFGDPKIQTTKNKEQENRSGGHHKGKKKSRYSKKPSYPKTSSMDLTSSNTVKEQDCRIGCLEDSKSDLCHKENTLSSADNLKGQEIIWTVQKDHEVAIKTENQLDLARGTCKPKVIVSKKKCGKQGHKNKISRLLEVGHESKRTDIASLATKHELAETVELDTSPVCQQSCSEPGILDEYKKIETCDLANGDHSTLGIYTSSPECLRKSGQVGYKHVSKIAPMLQTAASSLTNITNSAYRTSATCGVIPTSSLKDNEYQTLESTFSCSGLDTDLVVKGNEECASGITSLPTTANEILASTEDDSSLVQNDCNLCYRTSQTGYTQGESYEWGSTPSHSLLSTNLLPFPAANDRLHADIAQKRSTYFHQPILSSRHQAMNSSVESSCGHVLPSLTLPMSFDWPPMVRSWSRLSQTATANYDSGYDPRLFSACFAGPRMQNSSSYPDKDGMHTGDAMDAHDIKDPPDLSDDVDSYWFSEEESETHVLSGGDYNQFFGGGIMYWNSSEHVGTGFSRPPSHSSDDSAWAWYEADLNRAIDDMVGVPGLSASYNANGMASPPAPPFCPSVDPLVHGHQSVGYAVPGNEITGKVLSSSSVFDTPDGKISKTVASSSGSEGMKGDTLQYSMLRPIIVPSMSRRGSRSEFKLINDHKSPCIPSTRREAPRIKRPPSPVVLCVPRVPRPPPPSPVGESRKRGFPIVRSGSSSPRHWGLKSWYSDESSSDESRLFFEGAEIVWPSWGGKGLTSSPLVQPLHGSLLTDQLITISQLARDQEHPDVALPFQPSDLLSSPSKKTSLSMMQNLLHEEIDFFCKKVFAENLVKRPYINWAVKRVTRSLQVLWPRSRTNIFGSNATGLALPTSDVDLVVSLPPVRNLEPIKEAGILEGRNGIKETCLQHAARYLANQEWVRNDSLKTIENTAIPVIMLVAEVPHEIDLSSDNSPQAKQADTDRKQNDHLDSDFPNLENHPLTTTANRKKDDHPNVKSIRLDISFKSPTHSGLHTSQLVRELTQQFPASVPLALVLKKFLADRSLDQAYSGGLSSYCLVLLIIRFLQHEHHVGRTNNQNLGGLLMDFLYFFGNVFDPRQMRISIQGSGVYMNRERGLSIDPIHIDDPLYPSNNVGRNCFRIHQCIKAFADAYLVLENELPRFSGDSIQFSSGNLKLLQKIIPSIKCD